MGKNTSLFLVGISTSLIPCPPLVTMFILAAKKSSLISGGLWIGINLSPLIIAGGGLSIISKVIKAEVKGLVPFLQGLSVVMIIFMGNFI